MGPSQGHQLHHPEPHNRMNDIEFWLASYAMCLRKEANFCVKIKD